MYPFKCNKKNNTGTVPMLTLRCQKDGKILPHTRALKCVPIQLQRIIFFIIFDGKCMKKFPSHPCFEMCAYTVTTYYIVYNIRLKKCKINHVPF